MEIPEDKKYFRIGEVSKIIGVEPYVLRYWEKEFPQVRPSRADSNQRTYQRKDLETILEIKRLLYEEKLTIQGVRRRLKYRDMQDPSVRKTTLKDLKEELEEILKVLI